MENSINTFRKFALFSQQVLGSNKLFRTLECKLVEKSSTELIPPIFIIGAPRTGSTLLSQLLIEKFFFSYLTNIQSLFYGCPAAVFKMTRFFSNKIKPQSELKSNYGYVKGLLAPSEAGAVFKYWFGEKDFSLTIGKSQINFVRNSIKYMSHASSAPFLSKNLNNSMRLSTISTVFPEAFYIWIKRCPLYTGQSLLKMRYDLNGCYHKWASVRPKEYEELLSYSPYMQVVMQIKGIDGYIKQQLDKIKSSYVIKIYYDNLCINWQKELDIIAKKYQNTTGIELKEKRSRSSFKIENTDKKKLPDKEWEHLVLTVNSVYGSRFEP